MELIIFIAYVAMVLNTFRYAGHLQIERAKSTECRWPNICDEHRCKNCGDRLGEHECHRRYSHNECKNYEPVSYHISLSGPTMLMLSALGKSVVWPVSIPVYYVKKVSIDTGKFFKAPPAIESKEVKAERRTAERELALARAEAELESANQKLRELGIE